MFPGPAEDEQANRNLEEGLRKASPETLRAFVFLAVAIQVGLFAASLGVLLVGFREQRLLGGALAVGGLLALALSVAGYRRHRRRVRS